MSDYLLHYVISLSMVTMNAALIGLFAFFRRGQSGAALIFAFYCLAVGWWAFWQIFMIVPTDLARSHIAGKISQMGVAFIATLFFHFCVKFLDSKNQLDQFLLRAGYAFSGFILIIIPTPYFTADTIPKFGGKIHYLNAGPVDIFYIAYFFCIVIYALTRLFQAHRRLVGYQKEQIKWVIFGTLAAYAGGGANYFLSFSIDPYPWVPFGNYGVVMNFICFGFAIFRYRFLDIDDVVEKIRATRLAAIGLLSASINHEIRSPLFVIKGHAETLLAQMERGVYEKLSDNERKERVKQLLQKTIDQSERIADIAHRLTDFSKPSTGKETTESVALNESVDNVLSFVEHGLRVGNIKIEKNVPPQINIQVNRKHLEQILLNLVINASQAIGRQTGQIKIEASEEKDKFEIRVSDTGPGIPPDKIAHVFEPFFTTKQSGTGLGLYITKQLIKRNGGKIWFKSSDKGTTFFIEFKS